MIELGESGVDVGLFLPRRGRIVGGAAEKQQDDFAIRMFQLVEQTAQAISKIDNEAAASPSGRCEHENSRPIVAQRQTRLADRLIENVRMSDLLDLFSQPSHEPQVIVRKRQPSQGSGSLRLQGTRHVVELLARQPIRELIQHAPPVITDWLQG